MSPGLAARTVLVCMLVLGGGISRADRRPVAVVDLAGTADALKLAGDLRRELDVHLDLQRVLSPADETALSEPIPDEDHRALEGATRQLREAEAQYAQFKYDSAINAARAGQEQLLFAAPAATTGLYAELTLTLAMALFDEHDASAAGGFALVHRLAPGRAPDPARYPPELVDAFAAAKTLAGTGTIEIKGSGEAWLDGVDLGPSPRTVADAPVGMHYVQLTSPDRETRGATLTVTANARAVADVGDAPASHDLQVRRARTVLAKATDAVARASAMQHLARLVGVADAVLISGGGDKLHLQTWRASAGFTAAKELGNQPPGDVLIPLAPPRPKVARPIPIPIVPLEQPHWYEDRRIQVSGALGVITAVVVGILWARSNVSSQPPFGPVSVIK